MSIKRMKNKMKVVKTCNVDPEVWLEYTEGELSLSHKNDLDLHRAQCDVCKAHFADFKAVRKELISKVKMVEMPNEAFFKQLEAKIMSQIGPEKNVAQITELVHHTTRVVWIKRFSVPAAAAAALFLLISVALIRSPSFRTSGGGQVVAQNHLEEQYLVQAAFHNPEAVSNSMITSQDEEDLVLDATAEKMAHMSEAELRAMMAKLR